MTIKESEQMVENSNEEILNDNAKEFTASLIAEGHSKASVVKFLEKDFELESDAAVHLYLSVKGVFVRSKKGMAKRDVLFGMLWLSIGLVLTIGGYGFIFWGAIVFGVLQVSKGLYSYLTLKV